MMVVLTQTLKAAHNCRVMNSALAAEAAFFSKPHFSAPCFKPKHLGEKHHRQIEPWKDRLRIEESIHSLDLLA